MAAYCSNPVIVKVLGEDAEGRAIWDGFCAEHYVRPDDSIVIRKGVGP